MLMTGGGHSLKVSLLAFGISTFLTFDMIKVVAAVPHEQFDHARTLGMGQWRIVYEVVVLGTLDEALDSIRMNAAMGWMMLTMVEGIARSEGGIGVLLLNENRHLNLSAVFAIQTLSWIVGLTQDYAFGWFKNFVCPYAALGKGDK
jgi:NitT/TauT family transport system permease protein